MTECSPAICMLREEYHTKGNEKMASVGQPVPWVEVKIVVRSVLIMSLT